ncbi:MAG: hypothetical protein AB7V77_04650 [Candidatus Woesearchaeota archaeon]
MKKGQVTLFIIIGTILLLATSLYFVLNKSLQENEPGLELVDVSLETRPTFELVEQCLSQVSLDGLRKISSQGGWLEFPGMKYSEYPYDSDIVEFTPYNIAYWRHLKECGNDLCETSHKPPLCKPNSAKTCYSSDSGDYSIQEQLENYINNNIDLCLNNFESLKYQYNIQIKGNPKAEVIFSPEDTTILLNYPIELQSMKNDNTKKVEDFIAQFDIPFANLYNLASEVLTFEKSTNFYEAQTMNLISIYSGMEEALPPLNEIQFFSPNPKYWIQNEVKQILQYDLLPFMATIRFVNANNYYPIVPPEQENLEVYQQYSQGIYYGMNPKLGSDETIYPYNIEHHYIYKPIYSKVNDGKQMLTGSDLGVDDNIIFKLAGFFLKDYRFKYNVRYPLIITVSDDKCLNGEGFSLNFATEVNIRNNVAAYQNFTSLGVAPYETGLADFQVRLPQNITVKTTNKYTDEPLSDVLVSYICGREFELGVTKINSNNEAVFTTQLPYCEMGGYLKFSKTDFQGTNIEYNNKINGQNQEFSTSLWPLKEKEILVYKRTPEDIQAIKNAGSNAILVYGTSIHNITENETVLFAIENIKTSPYDEDVPTVGFLKYDNPNSNVPELNKQATLNNLNAQTIEQAYQAGSIDGETRAELLANLQTIQQSETTITTNTKNTLKLSPGTYDLDISLFNYDGIHLPLAYMDVCPDDFISSLFCDEDAVELPATNFSMWMTGGLVQELTLSPAIIYSDKKIIIYILEMPKPQTWDDMINLKEITEYQENMLNYVIPRFE